MDQREFTQARGGATQCELILRRLEMTPNQWVPLPELYAVSGSLAVGVRVADLRHRGHSIAQRSERYKGSRTIHSFYRLETEPPPAGAYAAQVSNH